MKTITRRILFVFFGLSLLILSGCFNDPVRHLSSDVCLIIPNVSTKEEVMSYIGPPDQKLINEEGQEVWYYFESKKSTMRKTPVVGDKLGVENYDFVTITFTGERVLTCVYRALNEQEFKNTGLHESIPPEE